MRHVTGLQRERAGMEVLLTAAEAYPAFERAVLAAQSEVWGSFRIFDLRTRLRSPEARAIGETWFDLVAHSLARGVRWRMVISDFDPVARPALHRGTWASVRRFWAAAEVAGEAADLRVTAAMHSAVTGLIPRLVFWPQIALALRSTARWLNDQGEGPRRAIVRDMPGLRDWLRSLRDGRVAPRLRGIPTLYPATHHQKLAVIDRQRLYIGGLDLDERRWDTPEHDRPGAETWHDLQLMLEGPVVAEAQAHLETFLDVVAGRAEPLPPRRLLRTLSRRRSGLVAGFGPQELLTEILQAHEMLAARARRLIYLETQFFRDAGLARSLARLGREKPDLACLLILPAAPEEVAFGGAMGLDTRFGEYLQARALRILLGGFGPRLFVGGAAQPRRAPRSGDGQDAAGPEGWDGPGDQSGDRESGVEGRGLLRGAPLVYIHAKVSIFDDVGAIVSSANLNGRSLRWDTEAGVLLDRPSDVRALRERVMRHWLPDEADERLLDPSLAVPLWRRLALANARVAPERRRGFILPYDLKAAERFGQSLPGVPEAMV